MTGLTELTGLVWQDIPSSLADDLKYNMLYDSVSLDNMSWTRVLVWRTGPGSAELPPAVRVYLADSAKPASGLAAEERRAEAASGSAVAAREVNKGGAPRSYDRASFEMEFWDYVKANPRAGPRAVNVHMIGWAKQFYQTDPSSAWVRARTAELLAKRKEPGS